MAYIYQPERILLQEQVKRFAPYISGSVLDVGAGGHARYERFFTCEKYVKMDIEGIPHVDVHGSADNMPFPDRSFDSVVSTQVFEHLRFPEKSAQEIFRVLKPGGHVLITAPQWNELHSEPYDYWRYTKYGLKELFERNGFVTVAYDQRGGFFLCKAQINIRYLMELLHLYQRPVLGKCMHYCFRVYGAIAGFLDSIDTSAANRKNAIGWCFVFKKTG